MSPRRNWYAWNWTRGVITDGDTGRPVGHLHIFASGRARDTWVREAAHVARTQPGYREAVPASWRRYDEQPEVHA